MNLPTKVFTAAEAEDALLQWVNTFPLNSKVESFADLFDGVVLARMLEDIDPESAVRDLDKNTSPSKWLRNRQNLEAVYKSLLRYMRNHVQDSSAEGLEEPVDIDAIAEHHDAQETVKLLSMFLRAAVNGSDANRYRYIEKVQKTLNEDTQLTIVELIKKKETIESNLPPSPGIVDGALPPKLSKDLDLAFEEEHATLRAAHSTLKKKYSDFMSAHEGLQLRYEELAELHEQTSTELETLKKTSNGDQDITIKHLQAKLEDAEDVIQRHETQAESDRITKETQSRELEKLRPAAQRVQDLKDKVAELTAEATVLKRAHNMAENLKKKLEAQNHVKDENTALRERNETLENNMKAYNSVHEENSKLRRTVNEYRQQFESYERGLSQEENRCKALEKELRERDAEIERLERTQLASDEFIEKMQSKENFRNADPDDFDASESPSTKAGTRLNDELELAGDIAPNYPLEVEKLKAQIDLLKSSTAGTTNAHLRIDLEDAQRIRKRLEESLRELTEKYAIGQEQLGAVISNSTGEKNAAIANTRKLYHEANHENTVLKGKVAELQTDLATRDRELLIAKSDLSAIDEEERDALEELKETHKLVSTTLQSDLLILQNEHKATRAELEQKTNHLLDTLTSKDKLQQDLAKLKERYDTTDADAGNPPAQPIVDDEEQITAHESLQEVRLEAAPTAPKSPRTRKLWSLLKRPFYTSAKKELNKPAVTLQFPENPSYPLKVQKRAANPSISTSVPSKASLAIPSKSSASRQVSMYGQNEAARYQKRLPTITPAVMALSMAHASISHPNQSSPSRTMVTPTQSVPALIPPATLPPAPFPLVTLAPAIDGQVLARERAAVGALPLSLHPLISPSRLPLPASPAFLKSM